MKARTILGAALLALSAIGCASTYRVVDIDSKPAGAAIFVNGKKVGTTRSPIKIDFAEAERVLVQICKSRYKPVLQYWTIEEIPDDDPKKLFTLEPE